MVKTVFKQYKPLKVESYTELQSVQPGQILDSQSLFLACISAKVPEVQHYYNNRWFIDSELGQRLIELVALRITINRVLIFFALPWNAQWGLFHRQRTGSGTGAGSTFCEPGSQLRTGREPASVSTALNQLVQQFTSCGANYQKKDEQYKRKTRIYSPYSSVPVNIWPLTWSFSLFLRQGC